ncbi:Cupin-like domain-containing protein [Sphingomonas sp. NFR04]|uniref:cupin-like domain-containing protein n=1 Tax=Sphingomonas sp. NFR04 TaxID=1566283 RepID=UPI0008E76867|nr:cupin-like domain-containing protein [Sphingomonas sp. NFR04]SFI94205.1 Cupin-like domain-containing protein [Sphingomonas sp. NFR04]
MPDPADLFDGLRPVPEIVAADCWALDHALAASAEPFVVRGLVADWPLVAVGGTGAAEARTYLANFARDTDFTYAEGAPGAGARIFYDDTMAMNHRTRRARIGQIFADMAADEGRVDAPLRYIASTDVPRFFPGLAEANPMPLGPRDGLAATIWIGTATRVAAHCDEPDNLVCTAVGHRRFTLFPPDQFANLYPGPLDNTPGGRAISMVDFHAPDFARFPRFREALRHARTVVLAPGDALRIPSLWGHHVEALDGFNVMINYWWRTRPAWLAEPNDALLAALLAIRDLPAAERAHWRQVFDHYVFSPGDAVTAHLPEGGRGILDPLTPETAGQLCAYLLRQLSR